MTTPTTYPMCGKPAPRPSATISTSNFSFNTNGLGVGSRGPAVQELQQQLDEAGYPPGDIDGNYTSDTQSAVDDFQQDTLRNLNTQIARCPKNVKELIQERNRLLQEMRQGVAGDETLEQLELANSETTQSDTEITYGDSGRDVLLAQDALTEAGYSPGPVDGVFRDDTQDAAESFQRDQIAKLEEKLNCTPFWNVSERMELSSQISNLKGELAQGVIGPETLDQLTEVNKDNEPEGMTLGSTGQDVVDLQEGLADVGYFPGAADGVFDPNTGQALNEFQADQLQAMMDQPGPKTLQEFFKQIRLRNEMENGVAGPVTMELLGETITEAASTEGPTEFDTGSSGVDELKIEHQLKELGYQPGFIDGNITDTSMNAVEDFQRDTITSLQADADAARGRGFLGKIRAAFIERDIAALTQELVDGVIGEETQAQLDKAVENNTSTSPFGSQVTPEIREALQAALNNFTPYGGIQITPEVSDAIQNFANSYRPASGPQITPEIKEALQAAIDNFRPSGGIQITPEMKEALQAFIDNFRPITAGDGGDVINDFVGSNTGGIYDDPLIQTKPGPINDLFDVGIDFGDSGPQVSQLQNDLATLGFDPGPADGFFDMDTAQAVNDFQQDQIDQIESIMEQYDSPLVDLIFGPKLERLKDEQAQGVVGPETSAQMERELPDEIEIPGYYEDNFSTRLPKKEVREAFEFLSEYVRENGLRT